MAHTIRRTPPGQTDALACWSAVLLLRVDPTLAGEELAPHLEALLSAVSQELETDRDSLPKTVRCAALQLATHIVRRSSVPVPRWPAGAAGPRKRPHGADHATGIPFSRSIRLGRMG